MNQHRRLPWTRGDCLPAIAVLGLLTFSASLRADDAFLRGDANGDGANTLADADYVMNFLFRGGARGDCDDALDASDNGRIDISDGVLLADRVVSGTPRVCPPSEGPGEDPTDDELDCVAYGGGVPLDDPAAKIEVLAGEVDADGVVTLTIATTSSFPVSGYSVVLAIAGDVFSNGRDAVEETDLTGLVDAGFLRASVSGENAHIGFLTSFIDSVSFGPGQTTVSEIRLRLQGGTAAGDYSISGVFGELIDPVESRSIPATVVGGTVTVSSAIDIATSPDLADPDSTLTCVDRTPPPPPGGCDPADDPGGPQTDFFLRGDTNADGLVSISDALALRRWLFNCERRPPCVRAADINADGSVNLIDVVYTLNFLHLGGAAPSSPWPEAGESSESTDLPCSEFEVEPPVESQSEIVEIGSVDASPGDAVTIPVYLTNEVEVEAFQLVIEYDSKIFTPSQSLGFPGTFYGDLGFPESAAGVFQTVRPLDVEGRDLLVVGFVPSLVHTGFEAPPGANRHVFDLIGEISRDAPPGSTLVLEPIAMGESVGLPQLHNELTYAGEARFVSAFPRTIPGIMKIVGDLTILRGDANDDGRVDVSDPTHTLNFLFRGGPAPSCLDQADANDDGHLNLTDAIATLNTLFLGASHIASPFPERGCDETLDSLSECGDCR